MNAFNNRLEQTVARQSVQFLGWSRIRFLLRAVVMVAIVTLTCFASQSANGRIANGTLNASMLDDEVELAIGQFAKKLQPQLPKGWSATVSGKSLLVQRDQKTLTMPIYGRRMVRYEDETEAEYNKDVGSNVRLKTMLRFEPRLSDEAWLELSARNADLLERSKDGARNKSELSEFATLAEKYQLPNYETDDQSIFQTFHSRYYSEIVDNQASQEYDEVFALLKKSLPASRGISAVANKPEFRWPQVWISTEPIASFSLNKTKAQPLTAQQALERFSSDVNSGLLNSQWAQTIDWKDVPDFDGWIKSRPSLAETARKARDPKPYAQVVRFSKLQVEVKVARAVGLFMGRSHYAVAKHFRIPRSPEVDAMLGLAKIEAQHLTTYKGIGKFDARDDVIKQLGAPDHTRGLQNGDSYEYYFDQNVTLFYRGRHQVHTVTLNVPAHVIEEFNQ